MLHKQYLLFRDSAFDLGIFQLRHVGYADFIHILVADFGRVHSAFRICSSTGLFHSILLRTASCLVMVSSGRCTQTSLQGWGRDACM